MWDHSGHVLLFLRNLCVTQEFRMGVRKMVLGRKLKWVPGTILKLLRILF